MRERSLQNSASSRRSSATVIDVSFDSIGPSTQQMDRRPITTPLQELAHSQGIDENTDVPDAADYQAPFGEEAEKISESSLLNDMNKQLDQPCRERMQEREEQRDEMRREVDELRKEIRQVQQGMRDERRQELQKMWAERRQELEEMLDNRRHELRNEMQEMIEEIKTLINAVKQATDNKKGKYKRK